MAKSRLGCHADRLKVPGAEASTGSLGHGIGLATGMALGLKIMGSSRKVYVLIGDGEANEGSVWEALLVASDQNLINLTILYDHNQSQTRCLQIKNPAEKLAAFGCNVYEVDGHSVDEIRRALRAPNDKLKAVVCRTMKGNGCPSLVNDFHAWHCRSPKPEELEVLIKEIYAPAV
jgi:transketolase